MTDQNRGDLQKFDRDLGVQRERLEELRSYQFGVGEDSVPRLTMKDFDFLFRFLPENVQARASQLRNQVGFDHLVGMAIARVEELAGESPFGQTIETKTAGEKEYKPDFSQVDFYKVLLSKLKEFAKVYHYNE
jgi:hypothetical protein